MNSDDCDCAIHLANAFSDRTKHLDKAIRILENVKFDTIACMGVSGIMFGSPLALMMNKNIAVVRKTSDKRHSTHKVELSCTLSEVGRFIVVDDLIDSGKTLKKIKKTLIEETLPGETAPVPVGVYLYDEEEENLRGEDGYTRGH
jgi:adenine/guanine phosphoribosyltransferase-like PRPP-binding protein